MIELLEVGARFVTQLPRLGEVVAGMAGMVVGMVGGLVSFAPVLVPWLPLVPEVLVTFQWLSIVLNLTRVGRQG